MSRFEIFFRMHGRVKVKTDAQKAAEKKEKRKDHLAKFTHARDKLDELITQLQVF